MYESVTAQLSGSAEHPPRLMTAQTVALKGNAADAHAWFAQNAHASDTGYTRRGIRINPSTVNLIHQTMGHLSTVGQSVILAPNARSRFDAVKPATRRPDFTDPPNVDMHYLEDESALMEELSDYTKEIFGTGLTIDPLSGQLILRFGEPTIEAPKITHVSAEFREDLAKLPPTRNAGRRHRLDPWSLIPLIAGRNQISFVDEPEAYLHPPQAFKLGRTVAKITADRESQLIVATHDRNFVAGVLSWSSARRTVIRLERSGDTTQAYPVDPKELDRAWASPPPSQ